ncbi:MAG: hypothetical protein Q8O22_02980 [Candidatus Omnitrophota bacterium]|nr:hypothetical protein [Candidatus Omnitrophota bacterium]
MKKAIIFCVLFLAPAVAAYCGQTSRIELTDGSVINGEVVSFLNGTYTINTANFGQITVGAAKVSKIESLSAVPAVAQTGLSAQTGMPTSAQINAYKEKIMGDPEGVAAMKGLANNPQIQELAKDPQIMDAAKTGDIQALMNNEKFQEIVNNPEIQKAVKKLRQ